jgi:hypothetical protein
MSFIPLRAASLPCRSVQGQDSGRSCVVQLLEWSPVVDQNLFMPRCEKESSEARTALRNLGGEQPGLLTPGCGERGDPPTYESAGFSFFGFSSSKYLPASAMGYSSIIGWGGRHHNRLLARRVPPAASPRCAAKTSGIRILCAQRLGRSAANCNGQPLFGLQIAQKNQCKSPHSPRIHLASLPARPRQSNVPCGCGC